MPKRHPSTGRSVKSARLLDGWGIERTLAGGAKLALVGLTYELGDGRVTRVAFHRDDEQRLCVGYAVERDGHWEIEESEPFSTRALGYYQRYIRRKRARVPDEDEEG